MLMPLPAARAQPLDPNAAFLPSWNDLGDRSGWRMMVSPPFPATWPPPAAGNTLVYYAYAMRFDPAVADGVQIAAPWARRSVGPADDGVVERLADRLRSLGVQGVRPLRSAELALIDREQEVARRLLTSGEPATDGLVRDYTCGWIARNGVAAVAITPLHPEFIGWLACR